MSDTKIIKIGTKQSFKDRIQNFDNKLNSDKLDKLLLEAKIDIEEELLPPEVAFQIDGADVGTLGNFSMIIGKAKSGKTFLIGLIISAIVKGELFLGKILGCMGPEKNQVLYFDTEMGRWHVQRAVKNIARLMSIPYPTRLHTYGLRAYDSQERVEMIERAIYSNNRIGLVVIDGIRDLVSAINDEMEATRIASKLLKWTAERNIHIICVLHQNKGDLNARGHVGSELCHKAESVLSVTNDKQDSRLRIVDFEFCRNSKNPEPFAFEINEAGLPVAAENWEMRSTSPKQKIDIDQIGNPNTYELFTESYSRYPDGLTYTDLVINLKLAFKKKFDKSIGDNKAKEIIGKAKQEGWVKQSASRGLWTLGQFGL